MIVFFAESHKKPFLMRLADWERYFPIEDDDDRKVFRYVLEYDTFLHLFRVHAENGDAGFWQANIYWEIDIPYYCQFATKPDHVFLPPPRKMSGFSKWIKTIDK